MSDIADDANDLSEFFLGVALRKQQREAKITPAGIGVCLNCSAEVDGDRRWCDAECRDEYEFDKARREFPREE